jgi:hypothetical protein
VRCLHATAISFVAKFQGEVFANFRAVAVKVTVLCGIDCLACQDEFFVNSPLDIKENAEKGNDENALDFSIHLSRLFRSRGVWVFRERLMLSSPKAYIIIARVSVAISPRYELILTPLAVGSIAESHQARYTTPNKWTLKLRTSTLLREIFIH